MIYFLRFNIKLETGIPKNKLIFLIYRTKLGKKKKGAGSNSSWTCSPHTRGNILIIQLTTLVED